MWNSSQGNLEYQSPENEANASESLTIESAIANLQGSDRGSRYYAAWWLGRFRVREAAAIEALIAALEDESDRTPDGGYPLRRNAARALGKLGDTRAVAALIACLDCSDYYVRESAAQSLGMLGDRVCVPKLMQLLAGGIDNELRAQPYDAIIEALGSLKATQAIHLIEPFLEHPVDLVKYATLRAMYQLTGDVSYGERLMQALEGEKLQLRRAALSDLGAIGYLPAAEAIAETLAENSLKLISLKGILEHHLQQPQEGESPSLSEAAIHVMNLMDGLL
ncbi:MAG: HEAT repeat domain-containing protein [Nostocaceae cyanobacterium]|nr:HEAT repeat domain-containing protein [Nostocaceae cyanobacterium]